MATRTWSAGRRTLDCTLFIITQTPCVFTTQGVWSLMDAGLAKWVVCEDFSACVELLQVCTPFRTRLKVTNWSSAIPFREPVSYERTEHSWTYGMKMRTSRNLAGLGYFRSIMILLLAVMAGNAFGQVTVANLIGSAVDEIDKKYEDVAKAILVFQRRRGDAALAFLAKAKKEHIQKQFLF